MLSNSALRIPRAATGSFRISMLLLLNCQFASIAAHFSDGAVCSSFPALSSLGYEGPTEAFPPYCASEKSIDREVSNISTAGARGLSSEYDHPKVLNEECYRWTAKRDPLFRATSELNQLRGVLDIADGLRDNRYTPPGTGEGIDIYLFDTGIAYDHKEFEGRARFVGRDFVKEGGDGRDDNGHGTFIASVAAGRSFGVARKALIYSVKVLNKNKYGRGSDIIRALDYVEEKFLANKTRRAVVLLPMESQFDRHTNDVVQRLIRNGMVVVTSAGNKADDACKYSPGSANGVINTGAVNNDRAIWHYSFQMSSTFLYKKGSNYGKCVDVFAPGTHIYGVSHYSSKKYTQQTGTSAAAPLTAGVAAILLQLFPTATPADVKEMIIKYSKKNVLNLSKVPQPYRNSTPNRLLQIPRDIVNTHLLEEHRDTAADSGGTSTVNPATSTATPEITTTTTLSTTSSIRAPSATRTGSVPTASTTSSNKGITKTITTTTTTTTTMPQVTGDETTHITSKPSTNKTSPTPENERTETPSTKGLVTTDSPQFSSQLPQAQMTVIYPSLCEIQSTYNDMKQRGYVMTYIHSLNIVDMDCFIAIFTRLNTSNSYTGYFNLRYEELEQILSSGRIQLSQVTTLLGYQSDKQQKYLVIEGERRQSDLVMQGFAVRDYTRIQRFFQQHRYERTSTLTNTNRNTNQLTITARYKQYGSRSEVRYFENLRERHMKEHIKIMWRKGYTIKHISTYNLPGRMGSRFLAAFTKGNDVRGGYRTLVTVKHAKDIDGTLQSYIDRGYHLDSVTPFFNNSRRKPSYLVVLRPQQ